ncbi:uncharacterized protein LOC106172129 [Lingula anatina]|uniref:Uncharacterized protein LOC106172129 n=1 Tax=Lingula anatina TaxID=7574 RepID=A0A1S3JCQ3_LINAN|nr:uncharacterized protein LOC106172129 [Lingula anatina]|eukprot:XP_013408182.1 uncharacterized protein LOC106172129 [Lingula anatina]
MQKIICWLSVCVLACVKAFYAPGVRIELNGRNILVPIFEKGTYKMMVTPQTTLCDRTIIVHDFTKNITIYKDITATTCFITPFYDDVLDKTVILFKATERSNREDTPSVVLHPETVLSDLQVKSLGPRAKICGTYPALWMKRDDHLTSTQRSTRDVVPSIKIGKVYAQIKEE